MSQLETFATDHSLGANALKNVAKSYLIISYHAVIRCVISRVRACVCVWCVCVRACMRACKQVAYMYLWQD